MSSDKSLIAVARKVDLPPDPWILACKMGPGLAVLESGGPITKGLSEWTILADQPISKMRVVDGTIVTASRNKEEALSGPVNRKLSELLTFRNPCPAPEGLPFCGGWIGYLAYEYMRYLEHIPYKASDMNLPDACWHYYDTALVIRRESGAVWSVGLGRDRPAAEEKSLDLLARLSRPPREISRGRRTGPLESNIAKEKYGQAVRAAREAVRLGEIYQANLSHRLKAPYEGDPLGLYGILRRTNPSPKMFYFDALDHQIISSSPERLFRLKGNSLSTRPIAGTRRRGRTEEEDQALERQLLSDEKERAEHVMLVDLERNDLGRVCNPGTVRVSELFTVERYSHVMHLVSDVEGEIEPGTGLDRLLWATFPGGTITGAPKIRAVEIIEENEPTARGPYTGSAGYISACGDIQLNILIRTLVLAQGQVMAQAGGGIVRDSRSEREYEETIEKISAMVDALSDRTTGKPPSPPSLHDEWMPPRVHNPVKDVRLLILDNYDSFTYNLVQYAAMVGAEVQVLRNDHLTVEDFLALAPTHVLVGPGPGDPDHSGISLALIKACAERRIPCLGVCLGHQALGQIYGGQIKVAPEQLHGKTSLVFHQESGILKGLKSPLRVTRYNSLYVDGLEQAPELMVDGRTSDGLPMAIHHRTLPLWGVQFHPESILTEQGMELMENFLHWEPGP